MAEAEIDLGLIPWDRGCKALGASDAKARRLLKKGDFPTPLRIGRKRFFTEKSLHQFVAAKAAAASPSSTA